jgi:predicted small secreted protein
MKRYIRAALVAALAVGALTLAGCTTVKAQSGGMALPRVWGYVAGANFAQLDVADQPGVDTLVVKRVLAPTDAWIVVHADDNGMPGERVGLKHISKGESTNIEVPLNGLKSEKVIVAIHADKGTPGHFDFDMMKKAESPDRPFFVNEKELAKAVVVRESGAK